MPPHATNSLANKVTTFTPAASEISFRVLGDVSVAFAWSSRTDCLPCLDVARDRHWWLVSHSPPEVSCSRSYSVLLRKQCEGSLLTTSFHLRAILSECGVHSCQLSFSAEGQHLEKCWKCVEDVRRLPWVPTHPHPAVVPPLPQPSHPAYSSSHPPPAHPHKPESQHMVAARTQRPWQTGLR